MTNELSSALSLSCALSCYLNFFHHWLCVSPRLHRSSCIESVFRTPIHAYLTKNSFSYRMTRTCQILGPLQDCRPFNKKFSEGGDLKRFSFLLGSRLSVAWTHYCCSDNEFVPTSCLCMISRVFLGTDVHGMLCLNFVMD